MLENQKDKFNLEGDVRYINCAYMSPILKKAEEAGIAGIRRKRRPYEIGPSDYFDDVILARQKMARLIGAETDQVVMIPSVSYGFSMLLQNMKGKRGQKAIVITNEFPSGFLSLERWCREQEVDLEIIEPVSEGIPKGKSWNERILEAIDERTACVLMSYVHWMDGTCFEVEEIGERCRQYGAYFLMDGTQGVGIRPIDVSKLKVDAICCAAYKWLMGPYSSGFAYVGERFSEGKPLEETWMNRANAQDFSGLTGYCSEYTPGATRYNVGQTSDFIKVPMLIEGLNQLLDWKTVEMDRYVEQLMEPLDRFLEEYGFGLEEKKYRSNHIRGIYLPETVDRELLLQSFEEERIKLSFRGASIRVSPNVYNTREDMEALIFCLQKSMNK